MTAANRRQTILSLLSESSHPVSATTLAETLHVSRQLIVGDVALLRASGVSITATPRGYLLHTEMPGILHKVACVHNGSDISAELYAIVDSGCEVLDVIVEHPVFGQITGQLQLRSRYDADQFVEKIEKTGAPPLSDLTNGLHLHTLRCPDEESFQRAVSALRRLGFLYEK